MTYLFGSIQIRCVRSGLPKNQVEIIFFVRRGQVGLLSNYETS